MKGAGKGEGGEREETIVNLNTIISMDKYYPPPKKKKKGGVKVAKIGSNGYSSIIYKAKV